MRFHRVTASRLSILATALVLSRPAGSMAAPAKSPARIAREDCEAALAREEAGKPGISSRGPCHTAFLSVGQPEDLRNEVASMMSSAAHPTLDDVALAAAMADAALKRDTRRPWGYLARCDIARRMGNADTLQGCLEDLRRVVPEDPATKWALAVSTERPSFWIWALRVILLAAVSGTAVHAAVGKLRRRRRRATPVAAAALMGVLVLLGLCGGSAWAEAPPPDHLSSFKIDDNDPEASVPSPEVQVKKPLEFGYFIQDLGGKAEKAVKAGDHSAAARYFGALAKAAPTVAYGPRKVCEQLEAAGDPDGAIKACRETLTRNGANAGDFTRFVSLVLGSKGPLVPGERNELEAVLTHVEHEAQLGALPTLLRCEVDLRFKDFKALEACTAELGKKAPQNPKTISLQWAVALHNHDRGAALALIQRARTAGVTEDGLAMMESATRAMTLKRAGFLAMLFAVAIGLTFVVVRFRREIFRRRLAV